MKTLHLHTDGGSRGNPGPAAIGAVVKDDESILVASAGDYIGETTNNVAEYQALVRGLELCREHGAEAVHVHMDSELIVRQMTGVYKVKNAGLRPFFEAAKELETEFEKVEYVHVPREDNVEADALVNEALDKELK